MIFIKLVMLYNSEYWDIKKQTFKNECYKSENANMDSGNTIEDRVRNECANKKLEDIPIKDKMREPMKIVWTCAIETFMDSGFFLVKLIYTYFFVSLSKLSSPQS